MLVPALLLLLGLVVYKKVIEPRRGEQKSEAKKVGARPTAIVTPKAKSKAKSKTKSRPMPTSGRAGSVL